MKANLVILLLSSFFLGQMLGGCDRSRHNEPGTQYVTISAKDNDVRKAIERTSDLMSKAVIEDDFDTQLKYFTEEAIINPPLGPEVRGKAEIRKGF
jgi:hypothetical protein